LLTGRIVVGPEPECRYFSASTATIATDLIGAHEGTDTREPCGSDWYAWLDIMPPGRHHLHVTGKVEGRIGSTVVLTPANPQGINPEILLLTLQVDLPNPTVTTVPHYGLLDAVYSQEGGDQYRQVQVQTPDGSQCGTIDINIVT
jgi:hypothetical protein